MKVDEDTGDNNSYLPDIKHAGSIDFGAIREKRHREFLSAGATGIGFRDSGSGGRSPQMEDGQATREYVAQLAGVVRSAGPNWYAEFVEHSHHKKMQRVAQTLFLNICFLN